MSFEFSQWDFNPLKKFPDFISFSVFFHGRDWLHGGMLPFSKNQV
jgi:hypothetical protein